MADGGTSCGARCQTENPFSDHSITCSPAQLLGPWLLDAIPANKPVLVVAEGLTPYLRAADGAAMLRRIIGHLPGGEMIFDGWSRAGIWLLQRYPPVKASGAELDWSIDDPHELEKAVPGLVFDCEWSADADEIKRYYPPLYWQWMQVLFRITPIRRLGRGLRYPLRVSALRRRLTSSRRASRRVHGSSRRSIRGSGSR
ncbi:MAG TPA: hypothetical protein VLZ05_23120 [Mycobacterium sp.]|nr:hypothetical protein [Mycobacterium sp.]